MIHVIATIELAPGRRETFLAEFRRFVPLVRAEAGCLEYAPAVDVATELRAQVPSRDDVVFVVEKWASLDALRAHAAAPHVAEYIERVKEMVTGLKLQVLQPAGAE
jgi:quinol monooxygenase YgiN